MKPEKLKILIVDDNKSFREAVRFFLKTELNYDIVGEASNGKEFLEKIKTVNADIVLMDIQMPEMNGIESTKKWCSLYPNTKIIGVTMFTEKAYLLQLIESGFKGCVYKTSFYAEIANAIETVANGGLYFAKNMPVY